MSGLSGVSNHCRERSFLIWAAVGFFPLAMWGFLGGSAGLLQVVSGEADDRLDKSVLGSRIGLPVVAIARSKIELQPKIPFCLIGAAPQIVPEQQGTLPRIVCGFQDMDVMR